MCLTHTCTHTCIHSLTHGLTKQGTRIDGWEDGWRGSLEEAEPRAGLGDVFDSAWEGDYLPPVDALVEEPVAAEEGARPAVHEVHAFLKQRVSRLCEVLVDCLDGDIGIGDEVQRHAVGFDQRAEEHPVAEGVHLGRLILVLLVVRLLPPGNDGHESVDPVAEGLLVPLPAEVVQPLGEVTQQPANRMRQPVPRERRGLQEHLHEGHHLHRRHGVEQGRGRLGEGRRQLQQAAQAARTPEQRDVGDAQGEGGDARCERLEDGRAGLQAHAAEQLVNHCGLRQHWQERGGIEDGRGRFRDARQQVWVPLWEGAEERCRLAEQVERRFSALLCRREGGAQSCEGCEACGDQSWQWCGQGDVGQGAEWCLSDGSVKSPHEGLGQAEHRGLQCR
mmetsp:Transcript_53200/g.133927  ORF Transcript_53200/g.133927 Transcript_53200/m.133927 type:complete len:390 (+) Transcript_53200:171-1340(+)